LRSKGIVDLSDLAGRGVFKAWNDAAFFESVRIGSHGAIEWGPDLDACPDAMYMRLTGQAGAYPDFPVLRLSNRRGYTSCRPRKSERNSAIFASDEDC